MEPLLQEQDQELEQETNRQAENPAAVILLKRRKIRKDLSSWCRYAGYEPAAHHLLLNQTLEDVVAGRVRNVMFLLPPGSAKSTYISVLFPPWYLRQQPKSTILACSYSYTLIEGFGKRCRNLIKQHENVLGYSLSPDSQAAGEWTTTLGGRYFCAGVGAGIAGHRADLAFIDDFLGSEADADSKVVRENQWAWYWNDFWPRLKPNAAQVIVANRRHEEDLVGKLLAKEPDRWKVIKVPFFAKDNDPLGRRLGDRLWPEWFTEEQAEVVRALPPRTKAGLYDQDPHPEEGDYFKKDWLVGYHPSELPPDDQLRFYGASDFAVSEEEEDKLDRSCLIPFGVDWKGNVWILPDIRWKRYNSAELVDEIVLMMQRRKLMSFFAEKGQITKSIGPFLSERMIKECVPTYVQGIASSRAKDVRAQSIRGRMSLKTVFFPKFAEWWGDAEHEILSFPAGKHDDFVDALSKIGEALMSLGKGTLPPKPEAEVDRNPRQNLTMKWVKKSHEGRNRILSMKYDGR